MCIYNVYIFVVLMHLSIPTFFFIFFGHYFLDMYSSSSLTIYLFSLLLLGYHGGARVTLPPNVTVPAVIAFGDSIVDQGANNNLNTLVKANFPPYGKDFVAGKPTGRFSNNKTPADMIGKVYIFDQHLLYMS